MDRPIDWTRRWRRVDGPAPHPEAEPQQLSDLASENCLILLGQPGSGKTTEPERAYRFRKGLGEPSSFIRLRQVTSGPQFASLLSADRQRWIEGAVGWTIFLDGLDELPARDATLRSDIVDVLSALSTDGKASHETRPPRLIVTCRSSDLPEDFVRGIEAAWTGEIALLQLEPLTREDVLRAASDGMEGDGSRFAAYLDAGRL